MGAGQQRHLAACCQQALLHKPILLQCNLMSWLCSHQCQLPQVAAHLQALDQGVAVQAARHADAPLQFEQRTAVGGAVGLERKPTLTLAAGGWEGGRQGGNGVRQSDQTCGSESDEECNAALT